MPRFYRHARRSAEAILNARSAHNEHEIQAIRLHAALAGAGEAADRSRLLLELAHAQTEQGLLHELAWGPDASPGGSHRVATLMEHTGLLYRLLADVEVCIGHPTRQRRMTHSPLEPAGGAVLDQMAATPDLAARMALLPALASAVVAIVGVEAAAHLWRLPYPDAV